MIDRRDFLFGAGCAVALASAEYMRPRNLVDLVGKTTIAELIPARFGDWALDPGSEPILPPSEGSLSDKLYDEIVSRAYTKRAKPDLPPVMLLCTHGTVQSDALQLHRPETCYPALGFTVGERQLIEVEVMPGVRIPAARLTARAGQRAEDIIYWTRIGYDFPRTAVEQRKDRLAAALRGDVGDGILMRMSAIRTGADRLDAHILEFARAMASAVPVASRPALFGRLAS